MNFEDIAAFTMARQILQGAQPLENDPVGAAKIRNKVWQLYAESLPKEQLAATFAVSAEEEPPSPEIDRLCTTMILQNLSDRLYNLRMFLIKEGNEDLLDIYPLDEFGPLETYLAIAREFVTAKTEVDGQKQFYGAETIIETAVKSYESSPIIGAKEDQPLTRTGLHLQQ